ncbi:MAG: radical SAM protein [Candidatus Lokiarchaeota archaeon]|nr:radical SAM protein [Candidatus Lokiarchaeota archaeon]
MKASKYNIFIPDEDEDQYILYNSLSGAIFAIDEEMKTFIEEGLKYDDSHLDKPEIISKLSEQGIILNGNQDELKICKVRYDKFRYNYFGLLFTIVLTYNCNLACPYCYEGEKKYESSISTLKGDNTYKVVQFIKNQTKELNSKVFSVYLFGGEPLLNYKEGTQILGELQKWADENDRIMFIGIISNGTLLDDQICEDLKKYKVMHTQLTIDGPRPIHNKKRPYKNGKGTYNDIISSLKLLISNQINTKLRINIDLDNYNKIEPLLDDLISEGLSGLRLTFSVISPMTNACKAYSSYLVDEAKIAKIIPKLWSLAIEKGFNLDLRPINSPTYCGSMTDSSYIIDPNLDIYRCFGSVGDRNHVIGRISNGKFEKNYNYYNYMSRCPFDFDFEKYKKCETCDLLPSCGGGCALASWVKYGTYNKPACGYLTNLIKERIKLYLKIKHLQESPNK